MKFPSILRRIIIFLSLGSIWISEACLRIASKKISFTKVIIHESSAFPPKAVTFISESIWCLTFQSLPPVPIANKSSTFTFFFFCGFGLGVLFSGDFFKKFWRVTISKNSI